MQDGPMRRSLTSTVSVSLPTVVFFVVNVLILFASKSYLKGIEEGMMDASSVSKDSIDET